MSETQPDFTTPALSLDGMLALARALVAIDRAIATMDLQLHADADSDPTMLALRAARAALEYTYIEEVPVAEQHRIRAILRAERLEPGHA